MERIYLSIEWGDNKIDCSSEPLVDAIEWIVILKPEYYYIDCSNSEDHNYRFFIQNYQPQETQKWKELVSQMLKSIWDEIDSAPPIFECSHIESYIEVRFYTNVNIEWLRRTIIDFWIARMYTYSLISTTIDKVEGESIYMNYDVREISILIDKQDLEY